MCDDIESAWEREKFAADLSQARLTREAFERVRTDDQHRYAIVGGETIHDRSCNVVTSAIAMADERLSDADPADFHNGGPPSWRRLLTRAQALTKNLRRCKLCAPDLPEKVPSQRHQRRKSGLGWPVPHGEAGRAKTQPGGCI